MPNISLPYPLLHDLERGRVILFLGAGASLDSLGISGTMPGTQDLANLITQQFFKNQGLGTPTLDYVSRLVLHHYNAKQLQEFIREILLDKEPTNAHLQLPDYNWKGIVTINYDLLVERSFSQKKKSLTVFRSDEDAEQVLSPNTTQYLKLHGCIDRIADTNPRLILTQEHFLNYRMGRAEIFNKFVEWAREYTLLFIGFGFNDWNFVTILDEITKSLKDHRNKYYAVRPKINELEQGLWLEKRIELISATFGEFMEVLKTSINPNSASLSRILPIQHPIESRLAISGSLPTNINSLLNISEYVYEHIPWKLEQELPLKDFYKGTDLGWRAIRENLDVRRNLCNTLIEDFSARKSEETTNSELIVVKAAAGEGKTIFLQRLAYELAKIGCLCLYKSNFGEIDASHINELYHLSKERIFLFIDDAQDNFSEIEKIIKYARKQKIPLTIFTATRYNEYITSDASRLDVFITTSIDLPKLEHKEASSLIELLERHQALGDLAVLSHEERLNEIEKTLDNQLLVALYQATLGRRFEEIILDEYFSIPSEKARKLYRAVAILHRINVPVRSGLISRAFDINFEDFENELFAPLSDIIFLGQIQGEYVYKTRHPEIARIIFRKAYEHNQLRFNEYLEVIKRLNTGFYSDLNSLKKMIQYRSVREMGLDSSQIDILYQTAFDSSDSIKNQIYVLHQEALFNMHDTANLERSEELLLAALEFDNQNLGIQHSFAELRLKQAEKSTPNAQKESYWEESLRLGRILKNSKEQTTKKLGLMTMIKVYISKIKHSNINSDFSKARTAIESAELLLQDGKQNFNNDGSFSGLEASLAQAIGDSDAAGRSLQNALRSNPHNLPIALRLAKWLRGKGNLSEATQVLRKILQTSSESKELHFQYADVLRKDSNNDGKTILYHFSRSFDLSDSNDEAQFWFARYAYEFGDDIQKKDSKQIFAKLIYSSTSSKERFKIRDTVIENGVSKKFTGNIQKLRFNDGYISRDGDGEIIYFNSRDISKEIWNLLEKDRRLEFSLGFNYAGAIALELSLI